MRFLALTRKTITDSPAVEAVDAIPADDTVDPPTPAVPAVAAADAVTHDEIDGCWVEVDVNQVVEATLAGTAEYYEIAFDPNLKPRLKAVRIKAGPGTPAPAKEIKEIENEDGDSLGSATVDA